MIIKYSSLVIFPLMLLLLAPESNRQKAAFRAHYKGMLLYSEAHYERAVSHFEKAHSIIPDNYNFNLSLALALSRVGRADEGLGLLQKSDILLRSGDPDLAQKESTRYFLKGMVLLYADRAGQALQPLEKSIGLQEKLGDPKRLSIYYNALGYATMLNQGGSDHGSDTLGWHYHVHRRDLIRSLGYFDQAVKYDTKNAAALYNYFLVRDTLGMEGMKDYYAQQDSAGPKPVGELPGNTNRTLEFTDYEELLFLLDLSGSMVMEKVPCMGTTRFEVMKQTALFILDSLPETTQLGLGSIDGDCWTEPKAWDAVGALSRYDMRYRLRFLVPNGTTPLLERLQASPELFSDDAQTRKSIFLISDGANVCRADGEDICDWASRLSSRKITINILTFLDATERNTNAFAEYACLADNTGGDILYMDNYRCGYEYFGASMVEGCLPRIPNLRKVTCWGRAYQNLWAVER
ncbi:VWA domain-containing protein [Phaeodactylibacter sp.]|jgi:tetratricopeptide (TPR) repeat protein|uniref:VWA domain-containing protein n=1 Tax=Phaeodactylibacter sp. TaxID=1940289 RepID=UPI0025EC4A6C|nr:VWA domain-containing protein [Phaeodactylibacter sp.]MCI4647405.1 VWA domain-containing protein [Phaeodactylibacter sp.]MCI5090009.1 VWA domain-containing protein [Phaeodactylibacter sp.]